MLKDLFSGTLKWAIARLRTAPSPVADGGIPHLVPAGGPIGWSRGKDWEWLASLSEAGDAESAVRPGLQGGRTERRAAGGPPDVATLYRKYAPSLFWVCKRYTRNEADAEDMVQQVFLKAQNHLAGFRGQSSVYTWLYRIAVNECLFMLRKRKFESEGDPDELAHLMPVYPEREIEARLDLRKIMAETDPQTSEILFLLYMEGLTQEEVVETMGISRTTVNRKVAAFKAMMEKRR
jgi:RNA polymerase sigma-70 factor (ECF subfamily)